MLDDYGDLGSDYVFVNLWGSAHGHPLTYAAVYDLVLRIRRATDIAFDPHGFRHTRATLLLRRKVPIKVVSTLLGPSRSPPRSAAFMGSEYTRAKGVQALRIPMRG